MSIATYAPADETVLLKRFCVLTRGYFDQPRGVAEDSAAGVPLENLYRMLEALRYDAFDDCDPRIKSALQGALNAAFPGAAKDDAIDELERCLRGLLGVNGVALAAASRAKVFLEAVEAGL